MLPSGDELLEPGSSLQSGCIVNSAAYALAELVTAWGGTPLLHPILPDDRGRCEEALRAADLASDIVVPTADVNTTFALALSVWFLMIGFAIKALVDADPAIVGTEIAGLTVVPLADLEQVVGALEVAIGVIATPAPVAQEVCDRLVAAGVSSILNFAPIVLSVPDHVEVRKVDMSIELQILAFHEQRKVALVPDLARVVNK